VGFFGKSFRLALSFGLIFSFVEVVEGHLHGADLAKVQPTKLAAMETHWETQTNAPIYLFALPDEQHARNRVQFVAIPGALSLLAYHRTSAEVKGLRDFPPQDRPPVLVTYASFRLMVGLGFLFCGLTALGFLLRNRLESSRWFLRIMLLAIPLPYIACTLGWTVTEVGRQPWIVYNVMRTADAASRIDPHQVAITLAAFVLVYGLLGLLGFGLIAKAAKAGPDDLPPLPS
jgi:cytochrome d ubiquinol oxidase subunit I